MSIAAVKSKFEASALGALVRRFIRGEGLTHCCEREARERQLAAPAARLLAQSICPLQARTPEQRGRTHHVAGVHVERTADADPRAAARGREVPFDPKLLLRKSESCEEHVRAARTDRRDDRVVIVGPRVAVARAAYDRGRTV